MLFSPSGVWAVAFLIRGCAIGATQHSPSAQSNNAPSAKKEQHPMALSVLVVHHTHHCVVSTSHPPIVINSSRQQFTISNIALSPSFPHRLHYCLHRACVNHISPRRISSCPYRSIRVACAGAVSIKQHFLHNNLISPLR